MKDPELLRKIRHLEKKLADKDAMIRVCPILFGKQETLLIKFVR